MAVEHNTRVRMHPAAIATIVDAHERRGGQEEEEHKTHIIGTLMGKSDSNLITIDQTFTIDLKVDGEECDLSVMLDKQHQSEMLSLLLASAPDQHVVGWFSTNNEPNFGELDKLLLDYFSSEAHKTTNNYGSFLPKKQGSVKPIFVRVSIQSLRDQKKSVQTELPIKAYLPEIFNLTYEGDQHHYDVMWTELPIEIGCGFAERTALEMIMKTAMPKKNDTEGKMHPSMRIDATASNLDPLNALAHKMLDHIDTVQTYVERALAEDDLCESTGRMLSDIFVGVPGLDKDTMEKMLNGELSDLLMVTFLSQLANCQISINDKLKQAYGQTPTTAAAKFTRR